jgi:hypothetical protein
MDILKLEKAIKHYKKKINNNVLIVNERDVAHLEQLQTVYNKLKGGKNIT